MIRNARDTAAAAALILAISIGVPELIAVIVLLALIGAAVLGLACVLTALTADKEEN